MRIKLVISYDGTAYCGWQVQPNGITVQEVLEKAWLDLTGEKVRITGSGRTDAGVHALGQVAHFDTESSIPPQKIFMALNVHLPNDIKVLKSECAQDNFHATTSAKEKTYRYSTYVNNTILPLKERYSVQLERMPDIEKMSRCAKMLIGEHDFKAFCASGSGAKTTIRTVTNVKIEKVDNEIDFIVSGNGFLYNMVRIIVGVLLSVGYGESTFEEIEKMLSTGKRPVKIKTLPAKGLTLTQVKY